MFIYIYVYIYMFIYMNNREYVYLYICIYCQFLPLVFTIKILETKSQDPAEDSQRSEVPETSLAWLHPSWIESLLMASGIDVPW